ncbi:MAG: ABC transporter permease [Ilumatobacteraceae bacterium]
MTIASIVTLVASPVAVIMASILTPDRAMWSELWATRLPGMITDTLTLLVTVVAGTVVLGTALAWLVTAYDFPARRLIGWLLVTPLAVPGYVAGFVWLDTLSGPFGARGVRTIWLCAASLVLTLYPYVYLFAKAAFTSQGADTRDAARTLGHGPARTLLRVAVPTARPAIAAGAALVTMEVLTDIGTVRLFNVSTLADGVLRVWFGTGDRGASAELATVLVVTAVALIGIERLLRGGARYTRRPGDRPASLVRLGIGGRLAAVLVASAVLALAVGVPVTRLVLWAAEARRTGTTATAAGGVGHHLSSTLLIAGAAALVCIGTGTLLALLVRRRGPVGRFFARAASLGYAMPGPVVAVGAVITLAAFDRSGLVPSGTVLVGSFVGLVFALAVRFLAVGLHGVEAGLDRVPAAPVARARMLGAGPTRVACRIEIPSARVAILAATALLTIDLMKELPITLLLRPFGFDTLAVWVWQATSESLWVQAAVPSLAMITVGMLAVGGLLVSLERGAEVVS